MCSRFNSHLFLWILLTLPVWVFAQIPSGYYNAAAGKSGQSLQIALYNIIKGHNVINYTPGVWNAFYSTDVKSNGKIWDMYSDVPGGTPPYEYLPGSDQCGTGGGGMEGDCYSREHSFPKSWFNDNAPMNTDLFHIFPTDQYINNMHSNYPYAEVAVATAVSLNGSKKGSCATPGYSGTVFEPIDAYKGDFARAYFYMATRYQNVITTWQAYDPLADAVLDGTSYPAFESWYLNLLISWHEQDPVSAKEIARNDSVYQLQQNRNPFIDHPEYVEAVWTPTGPKPEPTNHVTNFTAQPGIPVYSAVKLTWTDAAGTVVPDGYLLRGSLQGYASIVPPVDGIPVPDGGLDRNVYPGSQTWTFTGLFPDTVYYFKIFPYSNSGSLTDYKTDGSVPSSSAATSTGLSMLQPGDIAIIQVNVSDTDKVSFLTLVQLAQGTVINFTDNGFTTPTTVRTGEGFLTYTAPAVIPAGTVLSWKAGMATGSTGWGVASGSFALSTSGDQVFAYQGNWLAGPSVICGVQTLNSAWLASGGATSNTSYLPAGLINNATAVTFPERNGYYNLITSGSSAILRALAGHADNWTKSASLQPKPVWNFNLQPSTVIDQPASALDLEVGEGESLTIQPGIQVIINGNCKIY